MLRSHLPHAALVASLLLIDPAMAQVASEPPLTTVDNMMVLDAMGQQLTMPMPDWLNASQVSGDVRAHVELKYVADDKQAVLEILPKGENEALWTTLYGAHITLAADRSLGDYRNEMVNRYAQTCKPGLTGFFQFGQDDGDVLAPLGFVCGGYLDELANYAGEGEVMVMSFRKSDKGVAIVYQEWRGDAFDPSQPSTWPVATNVVEARAKQLQAEARLSLGD